MNRWMIRILGAAVLLVLLFVLFGLQRRLIEMSQRQQRAAPASRP